ncbi:MAG TPA: hypothetical protein VFP36_13120 [Usitatibacter sp.]|nr:hypothetical protein [Usitatibacter sp.]
MSETIVWLLIVVFTETGAAKPTLKITVKPDQLSCEQLRLAMTKGSAYPLDLAQCVPFDLAKAADVLKANR